MYAIGIKIVLYLRFFDQVMLSRKKHMFMIFFQVMLSRKKHMYMGL